MSEIYCSIGERRPKSNLYAQAEIERYKLNQGSFGIFEGNEMGNWPVLCENDILRGFGHPYSSSSLHKYKLRVQ